MFCVASLVWGLSVVLGCDFFLGAGSGLQNGALSLEALGVFSRFGRTSLCPSAFFGILLEKLASQAERSRFIARRTWKQPMQQNATLKAPQNYLPTLNVTVIASDKSGEVLDGKYGRVKSVSFLALSRCSVRIEHQPPKLRVKGSNRFPPITCSEIFNENCRFYSS